MIIILDLVFLTDSIYLIELKKVISSSLAFSNSLISLIGLFTFSFLSFNDTKISLILIFFFFFKKRVFHFKNLFFLYYHLEA